jgi:hypothetical protein
MTTENNHRWPAPNHNYVPEYQMSGVPFLETFTFPTINGTNNGELTSKKVSFDQVTRWLQILNHNDGNNTHVYLFFNETELTSFIAGKNGSNIVPNGYKGCRHIRIDKGSYTPRLEMKCKELWILGEEGTICSVMAGLTNIPSNTFPDQKYTNGFTGVEINPSNAN